MECDVVEVGAKRALASPGGPLSPGEQATQHQDKVARYNPETPAQSTTAVSMLSPCTGPSDASTSSDDPEVRAVQRSDSLKGAPPCAVFPDTRPGTPDEIVENRYIKGTRLTVNGWFQACRGCNNPTARTAAIRGAAVPMCSRCSEKFVSMCVGEVPAGLNCDPDIEPLAYWIPGMASGPRKMSPDSRRTYCEDLMLRQHRAWEDLARQS